MEQINANEFQVANQLLEQAYAKISREMGIETKTVHRIAQGRCHFDEMVLAAYSPLKSINQIASEISISYGSTYQVLRRLLDAGKIGSMPRRASKLREEFMAVYGPNKTLGQISKEIGRKYESVRRTHLNLGGDTSFPLSHTRLLRPKTESAIAQLLAIYSPDKSLSQIAKELDMPYHTVTYLIRKVSRVNDLPISQKRGLTEMFKDVWSPERNISSVAREIGCSRQQAYDIYSRLIRKGEISPRITALERDENAFVEAWSHEQDVEKVSAIIGKGYAIALQICRKLAREGEITLPLRQCANPKCYNSVQSAGKLKIYCSNKCAQERKNLRRKSNYISEPRTLWRQELKNALRFVDPGRKFITITESTLLSKLSKIVVVDLGKAGLVQTIDHPTKKWRGKPVRLYSRVHIVLAGEIHAKHNKRE